jgi:hypothetical protein
LALTPATGKGQTPMITVTYADKIGRVNLGTYSPADAVRLISNLQYTPTFILIRESGITIIP